MNKNVKTVYSSRKVNMSVNHDEAARMARRHENSFERFWDTVTTKGACYVTQNGLFPTISMF